AHFLHVFWVLRAIEAKSRPPSWSKPNPSGCLSSDANHMDASCNAKQLPFPCLLPMVVCRFLISLREWPIYLTSPLQPLLT
ncbi:hypothetical protein EDD16DRAFT_1561138, partial [Pisolithus croceorrhizus]